jgi:hypothetical protein
MERKKRIFLDNPPCPETFFFESKGEVSMIYRVNDGAELFVIAKNVFGFILAFVRVRNWWWNRSGTKNSIESLNECTDAGAMFRILIMPVIQVQS